MAEEQGSGERAGSTCRSTGAGDKDGRIAELENRVAFLENQLRSCRKDAGPANVTELKRRKEALRGSEEQYRSLIENTGDWVWETDADFVLTYDSPNSRDILGYEPDEVIGRTPFSFMPPDELERIKMIAWPHIARHEPLPRMENRLIRKDGSLAIIETTGIPLFDDSGHYRGYRGVNRDITGRKRAEEALRENEQWFRAIFSRAAIGIAIIDHRGYIRDCNPVYEEMLGYCKEELRGKRFVEFIHPDDVDKNLELQRQMAAGLIDKYQFEKRYIRKDGLEIWVRLTASAILNPDGSLKHNLAVAEDITARKRAEEALKKSEGDLERAQRIAALGSWEWDLQTNTLSGSREYYRIFDAEPCEPVPFEHFAGMVHPDDRGWVDAATKDIGLGNSPSSSEFRLLLPGNRIKHIHAFTEIVKDELGRPVKVFGTMQDITERKRIEEELKAAKQQAELYLDLMGHDINNMHQIALGYLELVRAVPPGVQQEEMIGKSIEVLQRSARLIKNVRKLQKLHEGVFQTELVDVCGVLVDVQREYGAVPGKTVTLNMNDCRHCHALANDLLHDVFANLLGNAIKHTGEHANIVVDLDIVMGEGSRYCRVIVEDDGPGVPDDFKGKIFNRLLKGTSKAKGMGLGLYLVKTLVDCYGGRLWVEDRVHGDHTKGARFVVMLPAAE